MMQHSLLTSSAGRKTADYTAHQQGQGVGRRHTLDLIQTLKDQKARMSVQQIQKQAGDTRQPLNEPTTTWENFWAVPEMKTATVWYEPSYTPLKKIHIHARGERLTEQ
jgi:hypothetical protein